ncbi:MAG: cob(I)yrinic acid a,c-diamide adenosyltransferase [Candidatus Berkelbacteria bacterium]|nr:cob(I)yrinic acid a,c-diamide adenosyltransferase [Candidatus Berkelbacteria bacterium]
MLIVYTGNGKGKTSAALGLAMRAAGWGQKVAIVQFIKGFKNTGEWKIIERIPEIDIYQTFNDEKLGIGEPRPEHQKSVSDGVELAKRIIKSKKYDVVILDEINNAVHYGLVEAGEIIKLAESRPVGMTVVFTGRGAVKGLLEIADLVTEMKEIKHPFQSGIPAKKGIDF